MRRHRLPAAAAAVLVIGLAGCSADGGGARPQASDGDGSTGSTGSTVLQPGRPGEPNRTVDPDEVDVDVAPANGQDATFMQMMVPHHAQAIEMSGLARTRARDERVVSLARRIEGAQGPEILSMEGWLAARGLEVPDAMWEPGGHDGHQMAGMLTPEQLEELAAAGGARFDRLYLRGMIRHHQGAIEMADAQLVGGSEQLALEMAAEISAGQAAEIDRMREILADL